jgi:hypothetical protein
MTKDEVQSSCYFANQPFQLVGLPTGEERDYLQHFLLTASVAEIEAQWRKLRPRVASGEVAVIDL